jgi:Protein of unknown function (DUF1579)
MIAKAACSIVIFASSLMAQTPSRASVIKAKMRDFAAFVGSWDARTVFHEKDGKTPEYHEVGTYTISWALDSAYLQWTIALHGRDDPARGRSMMIMLTYNPDSSRYESTYFYNRSAMRVYETGTYDPAGRVFRTAAFIPLEDGVHDERVRTVTTLGGDSVITYTHYSQHSDEPAEWNDFSATLSAHAGPPACAAPEYHQFDFWIGNWTVTGANGQFAGRNTIDRPLGSCVLQEHWVGARGSHGSSFNIYDATSKHWHQTWVDDQGTLLVLNGSFADGKMTLTGMGGTVLNRIVWYREHGDANTVRQVWDTSADGGKTWQTVFNGLYSRM